MNRTPCRWCRWRPAWNQETLIQNYANSFLRLGRYAEEQAAQAADDSTRQAWLSQARRRYETAYEISPQHESVALLVANLEARAGQSARAVALLESLVAQQPENDNARFELARLHLVDGRFDQALPLLQALDRRNPNDEFLQQMLLETYWGAGQRDAAEQLVAAWEARHPGEPGRRLRQYFVRVQTETLPAGPATPTPPAPASPGAAESVGVPVRGH